MGNLEAEELAAYPPLACSLTEGSNAAPIASLCLDTACITRER